MDTINKNFQMEQSELKHTLYKLKKIHKTLQYSQMITNDQLHLP